jgi:hypothetical protein
MKAERKIFFYPPAIFFPVFLSAAWGIGCGKIPQKNNPSFQ